MTCRQAWESRPQRRAACAGVARTHVAQQAREILFDVGAGRARFKARLQQAFERKLRLREGAVGTRVDGLLQPPQRLHARGGDGRAMRRHFAFQRRKPGVVEAAFAEEPLAFAHGAFVGCRRVAVFAGARKRQAIEEAAPVARGAGPEPVHGRR